MTAPNPEEVLQRLRDNLEHGEMGLIGLVLPADPILQIYADAIALIESLLSRSHWDIWSDLTCQWRWWGEDDPNFETGCGTLFTLGGDYNTQTGVLDLVYCPNCSKPIDCSDFGGSAKASSAMNNRPKE